MRVVVDANVFVSALISPSGTTGELVRKLVEDERTVFLISAVTMDELKRVLLYPKIQNLRKLSQNEIDCFLSSIEMLAEEMEAAVLASELECRDSDDIELMSVATRGRADWLVTGDQDLLIIGAVEGIPIVSPSQLLIKL